MKTGRAKKILFVPRIENGKGGGHFVRCASSVNELRESGIEVCIFIEKENLESSLMRKVSSFVSVNSEWIISSKDEAQKENWSFIVLDNFQSSESDFSFWTTIAPLIAIDEGGPKRNSFDFLIDMLPKLSGINSANISSPAFLPLPQNRRPQFTNSFDNAKPFKIIVVFGAEDALGMGLATAKYLASMQNVEIDLVQKNTLPDNEKTEKKLPNNLRVIKPFFGLRETLYQYDLVLTHYGITAFEAVHARVPVLLISPTTYHEQLAKETGFVSLGTKNQALKKLRNAEKNSSYITKGFFEKISAASEKIFLEQKLELAQTSSFIDFIKNINCTVLKKCPVCGESSLRHPVVARFRDRTYRRCNNCSMEYMSRLSDSPITYTEDYFFADYKKQYGKTYLEDFPHLAEMAKGRLLHIKKILKKNAYEKPYRLLDIGCAYGPFLQAAKEEGFDVFGIDPAIEAVKYVTDVLQIPALQGFFPQIDLPPEILQDGFDVISLWYVIEHFENAEAALRKISSWLKPSGVLAFSTPSGTGISALRNKKSFLEKSPADHWTIWNPQRMTHALNPHHLHLKKIVITGHHPERFPLIHKREGLLYTIVNFISKLCKLGDTFEAYSVKEK